MSVVHMIAVDVINVSILMPDISAGHPNATTMNVGPMPRNVVVMARIVVDIEVAARMVSVSAVCSTMSQVAVVDTVVGSVVSTVPISDANPRAANSHREVASVSGGTNHHQSQDCECCECEAFHVSIPIMVSSVNRHAADFAGCDDQ